MLEIANDNAIEPKQEHDRQRWLNVEKMTAELRGRSDLLFLAIEARRRLRDSHHHWTQLGHRRKVTVSPLARERLLREMEDVLERSNVHVDRFMAISDAMGEEERAEMWQRLKELGLAE